jgi:hypothetical protein
LLYLFTIKGFELVPDTYDGHLGKRNTHEGSLRATNVRARKARQ